jgi:predicted TPR repeat methyltransferase
MSYIRELTGRVGLAELSVGEQVLRQDKNAPVDGYICVLGKTGS